jgi:hypothetical protein
LFWAFPGVDDAGTLAPHLLHAVVGFVLVALLIVAGLWYGPAAAPGRIDAVSSGALAVYLFAAAIIVLAQDHDPAATIAFALLTTATVAIAWSSEAAAGALPVAAALAALVIIAWAVDPVTSHLVASGPGSGPRSGTLAGEHRLALRAGDVFCGPVRGGGIPRPGPP